jgi:4'-phosphopantetheinyl transferase EntD
LPVRNIVPERLEPLITELLPDSAVAVEAFDDAAPAPLFPAEDDLIRRAVDRRRREFATGRRCAREALGKLGLRPVPLLPGVGGAPLWPAGVVGSITHCAGYRGAAVARATTVATLGIDAEPNEPLPDGVLDTIANDAEREMVAGLLAAHPGVRWDRLLFSAKESAYKAWFPVAGTWLDFADVAVAFDPEDNAFQARFPGRKLMFPSAVVSCLPGRVGVGRGLVLTAVAMPR